MKQMKVEDRTKTQTDSQFKPEHVHVQHMALILTSTTNSTRTYKNKSTNDIKLHKMEIAFG